MVAIFQDRQLPGSLFTSTTLYKPKYKSLGPHSLENIFYDNKVTLRRFHESWELRKHYLSGLVTSYLPARPDWSSKFSSKGHHFLKRMWLWFELCKSHFWRRYRAARENEGLASRGDMQWLWPLVCCWKIRARLSWGSGGCELTIPLCVVWLSWSFTPFWIG